MDRKMDTIKLAQGIKLNEQIIKCKGSISNIDLHIKDLNKKEKYALNIGIGDVFENGSSFHVICDTSKDMCFAEIKRETIIYLESMKDIYNKKIIELENTLEEL